MKISALVAFAILLIQNPAVVRTQPLGEDYIDTVPPTIYEAEEMSPQNMDFDKENNMFIAHAGWYNDFVVHYYKFRIYAPGTYPNVIASSSSTFCIQFSSTTRNTYSF